MFGGDFKVLTMTPAAAARVREVMQASADARGIRIGIKNGGCAGMEYTIALVTEPNPKDDLVEEHGASVWVDPAATLFLLGTRLDHEVTKLRAGFVFDNPNQTSACGCGESVTLVPASTTPVVATSSAS